MFIPKLLGLLVIYVFSFGAKLSFPFLLLMLVLRQANYIHHTYSLGGSRLVCPQSGKKEKAGI
jgi:hypothetical protein